MNCIIIDDETTASAIIRHLCASVKGLKVLKEFSNAIEAVKYYNLNEVDLIFLDIHMPAFTGIDFLQTISNPPKIIVTTSDKNFAIDAFEYQCIVDYLVKPVYEERFLKAITKAKNRSNFPAASNEDVDRLENQLYVNIDKRLIKIDIPSIYLVVAKGDYINIKTEEKNYTVHSTLKKIVDKLPDSLFLKVHRSYIINTSKIIDILGNTVLIKKEVIPVSRSNRSELMNRLNLL